MPTLPNVGDYGGCSSGVSIDLKDIVADSVTTTDLTVTGTTTLGTVDVTDLDADEITVNGLGTVTINNRNMTAEVAGSTTHQVSWPPNRANFSGDGNPATNPAMGIFTVNGRQVHHGQILLERWPEGGSFDFLGPCLQITNPYAPVTTDSSGNVTQPAMTCFQFGHDFTNQLACSLFCFQYYGAGDSRNRLIIDSNANLNGNNPALVITMTQQGIPSKVGIHTSVPEAPLDVTGNLIVRDYSTKRRFLESISEGSTESIIYFRDTTRSTNYPNLIVDCYNGDIKMVDPETNLDFVYFDTTTQKCTFSKNLTGVASQFLVIDAGKGEMVANTVGTTTEFFIVASDSQRIAMGRFARDGITALGTSYTNIFTGASAIYKGSLTLVSSGTDYADLRIGGAASLNLFRTNVSTSQVLIGTSTAVAGSILTIQGNVTVNGNINSSNAKIDFKGSTALTGSITMGTEPSKYDFFKVSWSANTVTQTLNGIGYTLNAGNSVPATTGFRGFRIQQPDQWLSGSNYNSSGTYTGSTSTTISSTARLGDRLDGTIKVGTTNQGIRIGSITLTFVVTSGAMVKNYILYGLESSGTYIQLYSGANTVFTANTLVTITKESSGSLITNWNSRYTGFGVVCLDVGGTLATTNIAAVRLFSVNGVVETAFTAEHYIPNTLEVGTDVSSPQVMTTNTFRVNGDSALNGPTVIRGVLNVFGSSSSTTPTLMTNSTLGRVGIGTSAPNSTLDVRGAITGTTTLAISNSGSSAILNLAAFLGTGNSITDQKTSIAIGTAYNSRNCARLAFSPNLTNTDNTKFAIDFGDTVVGEVLAVNAIGDLSVKRGLNVGGDITNPWLSDLGDRVKTLEDVTVPGAITSAVASAATYTTAAVAAAETAQKLIDGAQTTQIQANTGGVSTNAGNLTSYIAQNVPLFADLVTVIDNVSSLSNMLQGYRLIDSGSALTTVIENSTEIGLAVIPFGAKATTNPQLTVYGNSQLNGDVDITGTVSWANSSISGDTTIGGNLTVGSSLASKTLTLNGNQSIIKRGTGTNVEVASFFAPDNYVVGNSTSWGFGNSTGYRQGVRFSFVPNITAGNNSFVMNFNDIDCFKVSAWGNVEAAGTIKSSALTIDTNTLLVDKTTRRVGIGTTGPTVKLDVVGDTKVSGNTSTGTLNVSAMTSATTTSMLYYNTTSKVVTYGAVPASGAPTTNPVFTGNLTSDTDTLFVDGTNHRIGVGTVVPSVKLDVVGSALVSGNTSTGTLAVTGMTSATTTSMLYYDTTSKVVTYGAVPASGAPTANPVFTGNLTSDTNTLFVDGTNHRVGIKTLTPATDFDVRGTMSLTGTAQLDYTAAQSMSMYGRYLFIHPSKTGGVTSDCSVNIRARSADNGTTFQNIVGVDTTSNYSYIRSHGFGQVATSGFPIRIQPGIGSTPTWSDAIVCTTTGTTINNTLTLTKPITMTSTATYTGLTSTQIGYTIKTPLPANTTAVGTSTSWTTPVAILTTTLTTGVWMVKGTVMVRATATAATVNVTKYRCFLSDPSNVEYGGFSGGFFANDTSWYQTTATESNLQMSTDTSCITVTAASSVISLKVGYIVAGTSTLYAATGFATQDNGVNTYITATRIG